MEIPCNKFELMRELFIIAPMELDEKGLTEKFEKITSDLDSFIPKDKEDLNKKIAEFNGIKPEELNTRSEYNNLCTKYADYLLKEFAQKISKEFEITEKQAWALIAWAQDILL